MNEDRSNSLALPPTAQAIADVIGREKALALARACRCRTLYVPKALRPGHWIIAVVGEHAARALVAEFPSFRLPLATCANVVKAERNRSICAAYRRGQCIVAIAKKHGLSPRQVRNILHAEGNKEEQEGRG